MGIIIPLIVVLAALIALISVATGTNNGGQFSFGSSQDDSADDPFAGINNAGMPGNIWTDSTDDLHTRHLRDD